AMDYWANVEAVVWFAEQVFPHIRQRNPQARFVIVGGKPSDEVKRLQKSDGITVTGAVEDVRPYVAHAVAAVAPLRIAQGVQNKVLEALAMAKPVLATPKAMEGIRSCAGMERWVTDQPVALAAKAITLLEDGATHRELVDQVGAVGRRCVEKGYSWDINLERALLAVKGDESSRPMDQEVGER
ncbi:MAG: glycosyltransferase, partial [Magnetococcales bacterium]|nr:glycosyltransferase [Magnetococcales bacterium]